MIRAKLNELKQALPEKAAFLDTRVGKYEAHLARCNPEQQDSERRRLAATLEVEAAMEPGDAYTYEQPDGSYPSPIEIMARGLIPTIVRAKGPAR